MEDGRGAPSSFPVPIPCARFAPGRARPPSMRMAGSPRVNRSRVAQSARRFQPRRIQRARHRLRFRWIARLQPRCAPADDILDWIRTLALPAKGFAHRFKSPPSVRSRNGPHTVSDSQRTGEQRHRPRQRREGRVRRIQPLSRRRRSGCGPTASSGGLPRSRRGRSARRTPPRCPRPAETGRARPPVRVRGHSSPAADPPDG